MLNAQSLSPKIDITVKNKLIIFITMVLIVITSGSVLFGKLYYSLFIMILFATAVVFYFPKRIEPKHFLTLMVILAFILFNMLLYRDNVGGYGGLILKILAIFMIINRLDIQQAGKSYQWIIVALALLSLPFYALGVVSPEFVRSTFPTVEVWNGVYRITPFYVYGNWNMSRNQGIFWEPGAFQVFLNLGIFLMLFTNRKLPKWKLILVTGTLLTTMSTSGYMICGLIYFAYLIRSGKRKQMTQLIIPLLLLIPLIYFESQSGVIADKFQDGNQSFDRRSLDTTSNLELMIEKPLVGWGFQNNSVLMERYGIGDSSNSLLTFGYQFGLPLLLIMLIYYYSRLQRAIGSVFQSILIFIALIIVFSTENMIFQPLFVMLMFFDVKASEQKLKSGEQLHGNEVNRLRSPLRGRAIAPEKGI